MALLSTTAGKPLLFYVTFAQMWSTSFGYELEGMPDCSDKLQLVGLSYAGPGAA